MTSSKLSTGSVWPVVSAQCAWTFNSVLLSAKETDSRSTYWAKVLSYYDAWLTWLGCEFWRFASLTTGCIMFSGAASVTTNMTF